MRQVHILCVWRVFLQSEQTERGVQSGWVGRYDNKCSYPSVPLHFPRQLVAKSGHEAESCSARHLVTKELRYIHGNLILYYRVEYTMSSEIYQILVFIYEMQHNLLGLSTDVHKLFISAFFRYFA